MRLPLLLLLSAACLTGSVLAESNQFWLAAQHDWGGKRGFFLALSGAPTGGHPAALKDVRLEFGVADGEAWRFISTTADWRMARTYTAKVVVTPESVELLLDGRSLKREAARLKAVRQPLIANEQPVFVRAPADYLVEQLRITARSGETALDETFKTDPLSPALRLFNPSREGLRRDFAPGQTMEIEAEFRFAPAPDVAALAPLVDEFGQAIAADWAGKVRSEEDLRKARQVEEQRLSEWSAPAGRDPFGGITDAPFKEQPTGYFRTVKRDGKWWLITPLGNPCFYVGLCDAPALDWECTPISGRERLFRWIPEPEGDFAPALRTNPWHRPEEANGRYVAFHTANLIRAYGPTDWRRRGEESTLRRMRSLGFSGYGKWCAGREEVAHVEVLYHFDVPNLARHPDIFDPAIRARFESVLRGQIEPRRESKALIGWSVGNEYDECIAAGDIVKILAMEGESPAKRALIEHAVGAIYGGSEARLREAWKVPSDAREFLKTKLSAPDADIEPLRRFFADRYYEFIYKTVKAIDPNHLYFGFWVTPNWWENAADWDLMARHCDVIGYDYYAHRFAEGAMAELLDRQDKPALCGEFACPPDYAGQRGLGRYHVACASEEEAGEIYAKWLADASRHPKCVGVFYFQYRDQPITGRGPVTGPFAVVQGESFAFGLVDITDRVKWPFAERVRQANLAAAKARFVQP